MGKWWLYSVTAVTDVAVSVVTDAAVSVVTGAATCGG